MSVIHGALGVVPDVAAQILNFGAIRDANAGPRLAPNLIQVYLIFNFEARNIATVTSDTFHLNPHW